MPTLKVQAIRNYKRNIIISSRDTMAWRMLLTLACIVPESCLASLVTAVDVWCRCGMVKLGVIVGQLLTGCTDAGTD